MKQLVLRWFSAVRLAFTKKPKPELLLKGPVHDLIEIRESPYMTELSLLVRYLSAQCGENVSCTVEDDGRVARLHTQSENIASISVYPTGSNQSMIYITVRIDQQHRGLYIWFKLAFIGYKVRFILPAFTRSRSLTLRRSKD